MAPLIKNYKHDSTSKNEDFKRDLNSKFEIRSTYTHYLPSNNIQEANLEKLWEKNRQAEIQKKQIGKGNKQKI